MRTSTVSFFFALLFMVFSTGCKKQGGRDAQQVPIPPPGDDFIKYTIRQGQQFCDQSSLVAVSYSELKFTVKFDNSAIYQTTDPANQEDINKLYGFSDNNSAHQDFSARFGWNWARDSLRLYAYVYNNAIRESQEIASIVPGSEYNCSIKVADTLYVFMLNEKAVSMKRASTTLKSQGYKLYPYFGGNETAPHDIFIWIREW
jgi:hypothetical protein